MILCTHRKWLFHSEIIRVDMNCIKWNGCYLEFFIYWYLALEAISNRAIQRSFSAFVFIDMPLKNGFCLYVDQKLFLVESLLWAVLMIRRQPHGACNHGEVMERAVGPKGALLHMDVRMWGNTINPQFPEF